jgi:Na+-transporting NADH:ubiquinone oxidoreductase subunit A
MAKETPKRVKVKKGYSLALAGAPSSEIRTGIPPKTIAVLPSQYPFIKAKSLVKEGDIVKIGSPLFLDKQDPRLQFLSPGAGTIEKITFGERRRLDEIVVRLSSEETSVQFPSFSMETIAATAPEVLAAALLNTGVWTTFRQRPFDSIPAPDTFPSSVFVSVTQEDSLLPQASVLMSGREHYFRAGIAALRVLSSGVLSVGIHADDPLKQSLQDIITHEIKGPSSSNSPGVFHYHTKSSSSQNNAWILGVADVIRIGEALLEGRHPITKIIAVAGIMSAANTHYLTREGVPASLFLKEASAARYVAGSVLTGRTIRSDGYLGIQETGLVALPEGREQELLSFMQPGFDKYSFSKAFLSSLMPKKMWTLPTTLNGSHRACIECGACAEVCPVDLLPQWIMKQVEGKDQEEALAMGMLDCTSCGLCSYVCPSKIEVSDIITEAKNKVFKELRS